MLWICCLPISQVYKVHTILLFLCNISYVTYAKEITFMITYSRIIILAIFNNRIKYGGWQLSTGSKRRWNKLKDSKSVTRNWRNQAGTNPSASLVQKIWMWEENKGKQLHAFPKEHLILLVARQNTGPDGPLFWASRAFLTF